MMTSRPCHPDHGKGEHITLLLAITASGASMKPLVVAPLKTLPNLDQKLYKEFDFSGTDNGWMTSLLFNNWVFNTYVPYVNIVRMVHRWTATEPALLIIDGPAIHVDLDVDKLWSEHHVKVVFLPPHSSAILQPLDLNPNGVLKQILSDLFEPVRGESQPDRRNRLLNQTHLGLSGALSKYHIVTGWKRTGLWPYNPSVPLGSNMLTSTPLLQPAPKPQRGKKRISMHSGVIISNGLPLPISPVSSLSFDLTSPPPSPKHLKFDVISSDEDVITIRKA